MDSINVEEKKVEKPKRKSIKRFCANCKYCVLLRSPVGSNGQYLLRVKCIMGKWKKKLGDEKLYKYFSVNRRVVSECDEYEEMGDLKSFLRDLKKTLPQNDEVYRY
jgi:hypothetical protein